MGLSGSGVAAAADEVVFLLLENSLLRRAFVFLHDGIAKMMEQYKFKEMRVVKVM